MKGSKTTYVKMRCRHVLSRSESLLPRQAKVRKAANEDRWEFCKIINLAGNEAICPEAGRLSFPPAMPGRAGVASGKVGLVCPLVGQYLQFDYAFLVPDSRDEGRFVALACQGRGFPRFARPRMAGYSESGKALRLSEPASDVVVAVVLLLHPDFFAESV